MPAGVEGIEISCAKLHAEMSEGSVVGAEVVGPPLVGPELGTEDGSKDGSEEG